jgi:hypothetical protein
MSADASHMAHRLDLSTEARVLLAPSAAFRELAKEPCSDWWVLVRRPLLLAFMFGCAVSLQASGRLTARLITDGAISFAFVPIFEGAALAAVYWRRPRRLPFAQTVDIFFAANAPWLVWLLAFGVLRCLQSPLQAAAPPPVIQWLVRSSLVATAAWSAYVDLHFFREVLPRPAGGSSRDLILQRAIAWVCIVVYFLGYALWPEIIGRIPA